MPHISTSMRLTASRLSTSLLQRVPTIKVRHLISLTQTDCMILRVTRDSMLAVSTYYLTQPFCHLSQIHALACPVSKSGKVSCKLQWLAFFSPRLKKYGQQISFPCNNMYTSVLGFLTFCKKSNLELESLVLGCILKLFWILTNYEWIN